MMFPIATELLTAERETLLRDHYETPQKSMGRDAALAETCDGCARAQAVRNELSAVKQGDFWTGYQAGYQDGKYLAVREMVSSMLPSPLKSALASVISAQVRGEIDKEVA